MLISLREAQKKVFRLCYQDGLSSHLRADVKGLQDPGLPCASVSCSNFAHAT